MRKLIRFAIVVLLPLTSCATLPDKARPIMKFYHDAKQRERNFDPEKPISLVGLKAEYGILPGSKGAGTWKQSSLVITDPNPRETHAVQVIVEPHVSGSFLDPTERSPEFLAQQVRDIEDALQNHRYVAVYLLPKPTDEQAAGVKRVPR
jgi:hypothetical protein